MAKKSGNFLEQYIDKIVLALVAVICLAIMVLMVVRSPNTMAVDKKSYGPAEIDQAVSYKTSALTEKLAGSVQPRTYASKFNEFKSTYAVTVNVPPDACFPIPAPVAGGVLPSVGPYREPKIGQLGKLVFAGVVSGVADIPLGPTLESGAEPGDVDLVTVQCTFSPSTIYAELEASFGNETDLQKPIFAAVELQRQEMSEDGTWPVDAWLTVKRIKADRYGDILDVEQMKSKSVAEAESLRAQLTTAAIAADVLQPDGYVFRSHPDRWLPPLLEEERQKLKTRMTMPGASSEGSAAPTPTSTRPPRQPRPGSTGGLGAESEGGTGRPQRPGTAPRSQPTNPRLGPGGPSGPGGPGATGVQPGDSSGLNTPETKLDALRNALRNMDKRQLEVTFWAQDDSVQPGKTYRYRLRLGLLNPIAGRGRSTTDPTLADKLLFWSEFSTVTQPVEISARMYLFATKYNETSGAVTIEVAKYNMARWEKKSYDVKPGEVIGRLEKMPPAVDTTGNAIPVPNVDFATGMTVVDVETITEYRPSAPGPLTYQQVLYKGQDNVIRHLTVKMSTWPKNLRKKSTDIDTYMKTQALATTTYTGTSSYTSPVEPTMPTPGIGPGMREE